MSRGDPATPPHDVTLPLDYFPFGNRSTSVFLGGYGMGYFVNMYVAMYRDFSFPMHIFPISLDCLVCLVSVLVIVIIRAFAYHKQRTEFDGEMSGWLGVCLVGLEKVRSLV